MPKLIDPVFTWDRLQKYQRKDSMNMTYELSIRNGFNSAVCHWWGEPPAGWEDLGKFTAKLIKYARDRIKQEQS